ncbi:MAG TPA: HAMP domain-containing sensor histidine kinase [Solirubrobacteraceae bacterium]|nr:HAMP domain-containing sensor histidine kinase [Solirubrobacteraceae bacterium]
MRAPRTIRARLTVAAAVTILAAVVLFAVATVMIVDRELHASLDSALRERAQEVAQLAISTPAVLNQPGALESPVSGRQISVEVLDAHGRLLARSPSLGAEVLPQGGVARAALRDGRAGSERVAIGGRRFELYAAPIADAGGPAAGGAVLVASDTTDIAHTTHRLAGLVAIVGVIVVVIAALAAALLTRRGLLPLGRLASAAGEIERTGDPSRRLPEPARDDEVAQLTGVLNRMLASLEQSRAAERRFLADASHELRTPVTALLGNVDYAARHGADPEVLDDLRHDAARLARLVDSLLALERAGQAGAGAEPVRVDELARAAAAAGGERVVAAQLAPATVDGDPDALRRALANLIDNGLLHGPPDGRVTIAVSAAAPRDGDRGAVRVAVSDEGPGPDPAARQRLFERFWRGPGSSERPGAGLGLSIVAAIAAAHGGTVEVDGSTFTLVLPSA